MSYLFAVVLLLGILIFIHELGHFLVARRFNIKVEVFSLGFGPKILKWKGKETEYCLAIIPFGGYVKMLGEDPTVELPPEERLRSFSHVAPYKRFLIVAAGPISNLILAFFIFAAIPLIGEPKISSYIAEVTPSSPAWTAGFRPDDRIAEINNTAVNTFEDVTNIIRESNGKKLTALIKRGNQTEKIEFTPTLKTLDNEFGEKESAYVMEGFLTAAPLPVIGISNPQSLAASIGFKTGDQILSANSVPIKSWPILREYLRNVAQSDLEFKVQSKKETYDIDLNLPPKFFKLQPDAKLEYIGLHPSELFINEIIPDTPAFKAGLKAGDRIISVNGNQIHNWDEFRLQIQEWDQKNPLAIRAERNGSIESFTIVPRLEEHRVPVAGKLPKDQFRIGAVSEVKFAPQDVYTFYSYNPITLVKYGLEKSWYWFYMTFESLVKLITGKVPIQQLGGPIFIGSLAGSSFNQGLYYFLRIMAIISVNLGFLNLLPIPVLDGGHLTFFGYEMIRRKPPSQKLQIAAQQVGIVLLLALMVLVLFNDIHRYWGNFRDIISRLFS